MKEFVLFLLLMWLNSVYGQTYYRCGICTCYFLDPETMMDCRFMDLRTLPFIEKENTYGMTTVYLNDNEISTLDKNILDSWDSLNFIDLSGNPIQCSELSKIPQNVHLIHSCIMDFTTCK